MPLDLQALRELLADLNETDITEFSLKSEDFELTIRRGTTPDTIQMISAVPAPATLPTAPIATQQSVPATAAVSSVPETSAGAPPPSVDENLIDVVSPMVGTFYRAPAPDEPPFVDVKDRIRVGQTVCIIEAMKLMNEIEAEAAGEVAEILIENGQAVEYGQVLMRVRPV